MVIAFQVILLLIILVSFVYLLPDNREESDSYIKNNLTAICISGIAAFTVSVLWL
jgi:hypothetical protein